VKYFGIDLGTTNSAICSFDGEEVQCYKSPRQHDVTPSAIYIDGRGRKFFGADAYEYSALDPDRAAVGFKPLMGSSTPIKLTAADITLTPEECSAEVLRLLFGYIPEEERSPGDSGTVITVPAAFNQMQKESTLVAAEAAAIGRVALIQEPVAAVMSVMRKRKADGIFVVYDLGGGTLDVAVAQSISGRVGILAGGGIPICGGRNFDRALVDNIVKPWLLDHFDLPEDFCTNPTYRKLFYAAIRAAERAKIELSRQVESSIAMADTVLRVRDQAGVEIYLDISIKREQLDELILSRVEESIEETRKTLEKAHLSPGDVERIVFVGGPTFYKPLRDKVARELGIAPSIDVNPMTAVAEGAAIFAESVDWASKSRGRKSSKAAINAASELGLFFDYIARTPDAKARIAAKLAQPLDGFEFQIDCMSTGRSSGRIKLVDKASVELRLARLGEHSFKLSVFDRDGQSVTLSEERIVILRTAATVDPIASHSIGIEVLDKLGGTPVLEPLVLEGEKLPKKGRKQFRTEQSLGAGSSDSLRFRLREGGVQAPIEANRCIGLFEIKGIDFSQDAIPAGAILICEYEFSDAGCLWLDVSVPDINASFRSGNFYSYQDDQIDFSLAWELVANQTTEVQSQLSEIESKIDDPRLEMARERLRQAQSVNSDELDGHGAKEAHERVQQATELVALIRRDHLKEIRQLDLDSVVAYFNK